MGSCSNKGVRTKPAILEVKGAEKNGSPVYIEYSENVQRKCSIVDSKGKNLNVKVELPPRSTAKGKYHINVKISRQNSEEKGHHEVESAMITDAQKTKEDILFIKMCLKNHFLFKMMNEEQIDKIIGEMNRFVLSPLRVVFSEIKPGRHFFIIEKGKIEVNAQGLERKILDAGMCIGEDSLMQSTPIYISANTLSQTSLWGLETETYRKILAESLAAAYEENLKSIEGAYLFQYISQQEQESIAKSLQVLNFTNNQVILNKSSPDFLCIIKEGSAVCKDKTEICRFFTGDIFLSSDLTTKSYNNIEIHVEENSICLFLSYNTLIEILENSCKNFLNRVKLCFIMRNNKYLKKLSRLQEELLIRSISISEFEAGSVIIPEGTAKQSDMIFILKGFLGGKDAKFQDLKTLGEVEIVEGAKDVWLEDVVAETDTVIAFISKTLFEAAIGGKYTECVGNNSKIKLLKNVPFFRALTKDQYNNIIRVLKVKEYSSEQTIFEENDEGDCIFIIKSGMVDIFKSGNYIRSISKNGYFGERSIIFSSPRTATAIAKNQVIVWVLYRADFLLIINEKILSNLIKRSELQDDSIKLQDLVIVKPLGKGLTGNVFLAVHKEKKTLYALKTVQKHLVQKYSIYDAIDLEREILLQLDHVFIMKLVKTFKDSKRVYFLAEYVRGMDLWDAIRDMDVISERKARFFIASLVLVLEDLHEKWIAYRDLKPENVVVDDEGYLKLVDFGNAKFVKSRTYTLLGTPQYMAPEIIKGTGYGIYADYWSLGIMMFEILFGYVPFGENEVNPMAVYAKVLEKHIVYPKIPPDTYVKAQALVEQLLSIQPNARHGGSIDALKAHEWFKGYDWDLLLSRQQTPPYVPKVPKIEYDIGKALNKNRNIEEAIAEQEVFDESNSDNENHRWNKVFRKGTQIIRGCVSK